MASPFKRGALTRMKERRATRAQQEVMSAPLEDTTMAPAHTQPIADTQVERQALSPMAEASVVKRDDPEMVSQIFSSAPTLPTPHHTEGKQVFTSQKQMEDLYADADTPPLTSFKSEFKAARSRGEKEFSYKGDRFNTRQDGETEAGWMEAIRTPFEPGFTRERAVEDIPSRKPNEAAVSYLMGDIDTDDIRLAPTAEQKSVMEAPVETEEMFGRAAERLEIGSKAGIDMEGVNPTMVPGVERAKEFLDAAQILPEFTSGKRTKGNWSLHESGDATDLRLKSAGPEGLASLKESMTAKMGKGVKSWADGKPGTLWSDGEFEYIIHGEGDHIHLHIEHETRDAKKRLLNVMKEGGGHYDRMSKAARTRLDRDYPGLFKEVTGTN